MDDLSIYTCLAIIVLERVVVFLCKQFGKYLRRTIKNNRHSTKVTIDVEVHVNISK